MTDVFLSYSHKDQDSADKLVRGLEAEGLSVWWDHAIPPGQTWDSFIAKGIVEAKAVIVIWSQASSASDWVKEEASIARKHAKYLPVQVDDAEPPIGFSRIQAAQLKDWDGNRNAPQWQMLLEEIRKVMDGVASMPLSGPSAGTRSRLKPAARPGKGNASLHMLGVALAGFAIGSAVAAGGATYFFQSQASQHVMADEQEQKRQLSEIEWRNKEFAALTTRFDDFKRRFDSNYGAIDAVRERTEEAKGQLEALLKKHAVGSHNIDPELLKPTDWSTTAIATLNTRLQRLELELAKIKSRYEGVLPSTPPPSFNSRH